jgi:hypothetical protein
MAEVPERTAHSYEFDMDRVIVDPDYRRRVIAWLRRERRAGETPTPMNVSESAIPRG